MRAGWPHEPLVCRDTAQTARLEDTAPGGRRLCALSDRRRPMSSYRTGGLDTDETHRKEFTVTTSPLGAARAVTKLPAQDLDRARRFYRDRLGLAPVEEREGGLRYVCGTTEFHIFASSGTASGHSTQMGFEVEDIDQAVADLRTRGLEFETFDMGDLEVTDQIVVVPNNYPSKGTGERGAFFFDSEGNLLAIGQAAGQTDDSA
jgi:catechol 2,3-dioxygenase-like lactoylglutathione lyase family enzyme